MHLSEKIRMNRNALFRHDEKHILTNESKRNKCTISRLI